MLKNDNTENIIDVVDKKEATQEEQLENAVKIARVQHRQLENLIRLDLRNYVRMLTSQGIKENQKLQAAQSLERAICFAFDFGVGATNAGIQDHGVFGQMENLLAGHLVKLKENGMLITAYNLKKQEDNTQGETNNG